MKIAVRKMPMPIDDNTTKDIYRVDWRIISGFGSSRWKTFGVYESRGVAVFVAEQIRNGHIIL